MNQPTHYDMLVIGAGPAGQKAAIQAAKLGRRVAIVEREREVGGACVHRGTIPSKALQERALLLSRLKRTGGAFDLRLGEQLRVECMTARIDTVIKSHVVVMTEQLRRNEVERIHGRARFRGERLLEILAVSGGRQLVTADVILIATGSRPRVPPGILVDHENVMDSDSVLAMTYLPRSLTVLGGGVIACEYASMFAVLGVRVTMIERARRPLEFLDGEITARFVRSFERAGGRYLGGRKYREVCWDGVSKVVTTLDGDGETETVESEKLLVALGRVPDIEGLDVAAAGIRVEEGKALEVDAFCRTAVPHIYAVGDVNGPPALASFAMDEGRRAVRHSLGLAATHRPELTPIGIYSIPEIASVGLTEHQAVERSGEVLVGRARFDEVARGQISGIQDGLLTLVSERGSGKLLGAHIVGEGATEMIHLAQMALLMGADYRVFVDNIFNFPTLAEAYRVAALDIENRASAPRRVRARTAAHPAPLVHV